MPYYTNNLTDGDTLPDTTLEAIETGFSSVETDLADKQDLVVPAAADNVATLSGAGALQDGGKGLPSGDVVGTSDAQSLTNKDLDSSPLGVTTPDEAHVTDLEVTQHAYFDAEVDNGNSSTAKTLDWGDGNKQKLTLTGNCTLTFTAPHGPCNLILKLVQDGTGSRTVTWPASVKWASGNAPTLTATASAIDIVALYFDGTSYYGSAVLDFS